MSVDTAVGIRSVRLTFPAKPEYITLGRLALTGLARLRDLPAETLGDLKLALSEACTNVVRHAYPDGEGLVEIVYSLSDDRRVVEVCDEGRGFTPPAATEGEAPLAEGGLGLAIIRALTDELAVERGTLGGSRVRFVKVL